MEQQNPNNRSVSLEKLQTIVQNTLENMEVAEESIAYASPEVKAILDEKNTRRKVAILNLREKINKAAANRNEKNE